MSNGRFLVVALAVAAVVGAIALSSGGDDGGGGGGGSAGKPTAGAIRISFAYSPEKEVLLAALIKRFNGERVKSGGKPVFVDASIVSSGEAQTKIARRQLRPVAWSPASSLWGRLLDFEADKPYVADRNPSLARTPLVIAMWEPLARALGWPKKAVGFKAILALALDQRGWAAYGKPQFGSFKLGHTNPDFSTSGLSAVAAEYFAATGKREGLTEGDINAPAVRTKIKAIERSIVHYGDTTLFFSDQLRRYGPAYASAVAMEEATLIDFNRRRRRDATKLVGLYPAEGTFFSDNPFIVLRAPWVTDAQRAAAATFGDWLRSHITNEAAAKAGFRSGDREDKPLPPVDAAHGANPAEPRRVLGLPEPRVLARIKRNWRADRKPANVLLVVDISGSMGEEGKLDQAKVGLRRFFREIAPQDRVGLFTFNDRVFRNVPIATFAGNRPELSSAVADLIPGGETAFYDATSTGASAVQALHDPTRINAVVMLSDGEDTASGSGARATLLSDLTRQARSEGLAVRVYTIAYGSQADRDALAEIARASGGKDFAGDPKEIEKVYVTISSFF